jgi:hypothetical protein
MEGDLRKLTGRDQGADETEVAGREVRPWPQVLEEEIAGEFHQTGRDRAGALLDARCAIRLGCLVDGKKLRRKSRKSVRTDLVLSKHVFGDNGRGGDIAPAGMERQMGDDFRDFLRLHPVLQRPIEI